MSQKLSVVVPIYNSEKYLRQCVDSILNQTYQDIELILVNDGSVDSSADICDAYVKQDKRVTVIHKENEGVIKARISGAEIADGECITFVDADDWIAPDTYEQMINRMGQNDIVIAGAFRYFAHDNVKKDVPILKEGVYDRKAVVNDIIPYMLWSIKRNAWELDPSLCTKLFRKDTIIDCLREASSLNMHYGDDTAVIYPLLLKVNSVVIMHDCYYYHRQRKCGVVPEYISNDDFYKKLYDLYSYLKHIFMQSQYWKLLRPQLEHFYFNAVQLRQLMYSDYKEIEEDIFPFWDVNKDTDVILYGAGETGKRFYEQNEQYHFCNIVLWADQNYKELHLADQRISSPDQIMNQNYDYIIVAIRSARFAQEIIESFIGRGIPVEKIIWNSTLVRKILIK